MNIYDLNRDQIIELKQAMLTERQESVSWGELADADSIISDEEVRAAYEGIDFTSDDFFSLANTSPSAKNTKISYLYRDADNYKVYNECVIEGTLSEEQKKTILGCLDEGQYFIPGMVGMPAKQFDQWDESVDHPWFELDDCSFEETAAPATVELKAGDLVDAFVRCAAAGWQAPEYPHQVPASLDEKIAAAVAKTGPGDNSGEKIASHESDPSLDQPSEKLDDSLFR